MKTGQTPSVIVQNFLPGHISTTPAGIHYHIKVTTNQQPAVQSKQLSNSPFTSISGDCRPNLSGRCDAQAPLCQGAGFHKQHNKSAYDSNAVPINPLEIRPFTKASCFGQAPAAQAEIVLRPFLRRALRILRPLRVRIRSRNPCFFFLRLLFGWNVLFMIHHTPNT